MGMFVNFYVWVVLLLNMVFWNGGLVGFNVIMVFIKWGCVLGIGYLNNLFWECVMRIVVLMIFSNVIIVLYVLICVLVLLLINCSVDVYKVLKMVFFLVLFFGYCMWVLDCGYRL